MRRYVHLSERVRRCRYFTEEERSMHVEMEAGVTTKCAQKLPDAGATRDMLGLLRQLFGDKERASFSSVVGILRLHADPASSDGEELLTTLASFENLKERVLGGWDLQIGTSDNEKPPPLGVFLDWLYGEFLHSDADKGARIERLDGPFRFYEWQFHWVAERLASVFTRFETVVGAVMAICPPQSEPSR